jgi:hypothetical protein
MDISRQDGAGTTRAGHQPRNRPTFAVAARLNWTQQPAIHWPTDGLNAEDNVVGMTTTDALYGTRSFAHGVPGWMNDAPVAF